jgi:PLP dependent protein
MENSINQFVARRKVILDKITDIAKLHSRNPQDINLVAACKTQDNNTIKSAIAAGQYLFGENRVHEGIAHFAQNRPSNIELRLIGPLQSNKFEQCLGLFDVIETLDRISLAKEIMKFANKGAKLPKFLIQVNIGEEIQKSGINPKDLDAFIKILRVDYEINPIGLMCIPPNNQPSAPYFALLSKMAKHHGLEQLSMGMSSDYESAIKFGATHIRIGTALFGER